MTYDMRTRSVLFRKNELHVALFFRKLSTPSHVDCFHLVCPTCFEMQRESFTLKSLLFIKQDACNYRLHG